MRTEKSYCRVCHACCGLEVDIDEGRVVAIRGDRDDPMSHGFICSKGRSAPELHHGEGRLVQTMARSASGALEPIDSEVALARIAAQIGEQVDRWGGESVAIYVGTQANLNALSPAFAFAFAKALDTPRTYGTMTIDQSAKWIADGRMGNWAAGMQRFEEADVWMLVGANPLVTMSAAAGSQIFLFNDPIRSIKAARDRGMKLIIVDPRESDIARHADLHLRPRPGQDVPVLAAMCRIILERGWQDATFLADYAAGLGDLRQALGPFTPEAAGALADVPPAEIEAAAEMFAHAARSGMCGSGTGIGMAARSNLAEHLVCLLNVLTGRFPRAGEPVSRASVLQPFTPPSEGVGGGNREWDDGPRSVVHGLGRIRGQAMTATLADEILDAGDRRIRTLITVGGNPAMALPDQARARRALGSLDLLIAIDPRLSATTAQAHYVFPPLLPFERTDHTGVIEGFFREPYAHYAPPLVDPPPGAVDDWYVFWRIAAHMGLPLTFAGQSLDMSNAPTREALLAMIAAHGRIPLDTVRAAQGGRLYPVDARIGEPSADATPRRFALLPPDVAEELAAAGEELRHAAPPPRFQMIVRRHREVMNSAGIDLDSTRRKWPLNPAFLHPDDLSRLAVEAGAPLIISNGRRRIRTVAAADATLRPGTVSIAHCWSGDPADPMESTSMLIDAEERVEAINRMPLMTGIAVDITPVDRA